MAVCYLCGHDGADTAEHVVPRCLYPGKLPSDVITLPAHGSCNRFTAKHEEAFRNHISVAIPPENPGYALWEATWKATHRPEAKGMQRTFFRDMLSLPELDAAGVVRARPMVARLEYERAHWVLAKIVRGLFTWQTGELLPSTETLWRFGQAEFGRENLRMPQAFTVHDVLMVQWKREADESFTSVWVLGFHRTAWFWVSTMPTWCSPSGIEGDARPMIWPGPRGCPR